MDRSTITKSERWYIADKMASDILPIVNEKCKIPQPKTTLYSTYIKRLFDISISLIVLVLTLPINMLIACITYFDLGRPIFFKQTRIGKDGKPFTLVKFRNMKNIYDKDGNPLPAELRVTKIGKFFRKTSLDELLNFWSILKGDMSLIGPRPLVPEYTHRYNNRHLMRLAVKPGLECPPHDFKSNHVFSWNEQFENDIWYVENISFRNDCRLLKNLIKFALDNKSADARALAGRGSFMGYSLNGTAINLDDVDEYYIKMIEDLRESK